MKEIVAMQQHGTSIGVGKADSELMLLQGGAARGDQSRPFGREKCILFTRTETMNSVEETLTRGIDEDYADHVAIVLICSRRRRK